MEVNDQLNDLLLNWLPPIIHWTRWSTEQAINYSQLHYQMPRRRVSRSSWSSLDFSFSVQLPGAIAVVRECFYRFEVTEALAGDLQSVHHPVAEKKRKQSIREREGTSEWINEVPSISSRKGDAFAPSQRTPARCYRLETARNTSARNALVSGLPRALGSRSRMIYGGPFLAERSRMPRSRKRSCCDRRKIRDYGYLPRSWIMPLIRGFRRPLEISLDKGARMGELVYYLKKKE